MLASLLMFLNPNMLVSLQKLLIPSRLASLLKFLNPSMLASLLKFLNPSMLASLFVPRGTFLAVLPLGPIVLGETVTAPLTTAQHSKVPYKELPLKPYITSYCCFDTFNKDISFGLLKRIL